MSLNQSNTPKSDDPLGLLESLESLFTIVLGVFEVLGKDEVQSELHHTTIIRVRCTKCGRHAIITSTYLNALIPFKRKGCSQCEK